MLTFREVARQRSFSRAARELSLSQPSVSNQVALLERELGVRLLERAHRSVRLTPEGEILLNHADAVAERFALAEAQLAAAAEGVRAQLRIGAFSTALAALVPEAIERLRRDHPGARVTADEGGDELAGRVRDGALHLALAFQATDEPRLEPVGLERRDLVREDFLVALAPDHPLAANPAIPLEALADADWTAGAADGPIVRACRAAGFEPRVVSLTADPLAVRALVARGLAVTLVPELLFEPVEGLALRPVQCAGPARDVYALLPPGGRHPLASAALDALAEAAARLRGSRSAPRRPMRGV